MLICNKCGKTGKRGKFCVYCGGELSEFFTIKTVESDAEPTAECPECGKKFADGKFCVFCGTALKPIGGAVIDDAPAVQEMSEPVVETPAAEVPEAGGQLVCVECGKIHERGKFCTSCGGALRAVGAVEGSPAPIVEEAPVIKTPAAEATAADNSKLICPACGKIHERGKFCTVCGTGLQPMGAAPQPELAVQPEPVQQMPVQPAVQTTDGKLVCTECGKVHERGKFCTACGGNLVPAGAPSEQPAPAPAPLMAPPTPAPIPSAPTASHTSGLVCPSCGKTFERGKFCTVCGTTLVAQSDQTSAPVNDGMMHCTQCGKTFPSGKFCTVCGGKLVTSDMLNV
ncbi:hypothetical protein [Ruminococcus albus]|uniref:DZANK-type domain-containing protein n=1 Tax=Ruminococcus albus 8 TaxID=246199 RepID=E9SEL1_RUMAL|nr:hypothetical protein [Ruminococcus albus]EGC02244.1 hypothetical protein CUS_5770 [Ruminococcus albus 8]MCC3351709.1 hypothetical protein [Ruminococcus albus 8]